MFLNYLDSFAHSAAAGKAIANVKQAYRCMIHVVGKAFGIELCCGGASAYLYTHVHIVVYVYMHKFIWRPCTAASMPRLNCRYQC